MIALHRKFADVICEWITEKGNMAFSKSTSFKSQHSAKCLSWQIRIKSLWLFVDAKLNGQPVVPAAPCTLPSHHLHRTYLASAFFRLALWPLLVKRRLVKVNVSQNRLSIKSCQKATVFPTRLLILPFSIFFVKNRKIDHCLNSIRRSKKWTSASAGFAARRDRDPWMHRALPTVLCILSVINPQRLPQGKKMR